MLFDACSIYHAIAEGKYKLLDGKYSVILARYELGNVIWKQTVLLKALKIEDARSIIGNIDRVLGQMKLLHPESRQIYELAVKYNITYYDASYVMAAVSYKIPFITEDNMLRKKIKKDIEVYSFSEIFKSL